MNHHLITNNSKEHQQASHQAREPIFDIKAQTRGKQHKLMNTTSAISAVNLKSPVCATARLETTWTPEDFIPK